MRDEILSFFTQPNHIGLDWSRRDVRTKVLGYWPETDKYSEFEKAFNALRKEGRLEHTRTVTASGAYVLLYKLVHSQDE